MVLSSVVMGKLTFDAGLPPGLSIFFGLICGLSIGAINGVLVAFVKLPPFIVTLGMWQIALAANFLYSDSQDSYRILLTKPHYYNTSVKL